MKNLHALIVFGLIPLAAAPAYAGHRPMPLASGSSSLHAAAQEDMLYYGGPVLSHAKVYAVFWGKNVNAEVQAKIGGFYTDAVDSTYVDWLNEYKTDVTAVDGRAGTNQEIGRGSFAGSVTITPKNTATKLDKKDVEAELEAQIESGTLAVPDANTLYMVHFPAGITLTASGMASCQAWCGDHESFDSEKYGPVYYAMMPDLGGMCSFGCAFGSNDFDSMTTIASHELVEAITDPHCLDMSLPNGYPGAWITADQNEVGDLCTAEAATLKTATTAYQVQKIWDNTVKSCKGGTFTRP